MAGLWASELAATARLARHGCGRPMTLPKGLFFRPRRAPAIRRGFFKARVARQEDEIQVAGGTIALLGDDDLGFGAVFFGQVGLVEIRAVDE